MVQMVVLSCFALLERDRNADFCVLQDPLTTAFLISSSLIAEFFDFLF